MNLDELQKSEIGFLSHIGGKLVNFSKGYAELAFEELLKAQAKVVNKTRKTVFVVIELFDKDKIVAYSTATYSIITEKRNSKC
jgi:acyl-coenzyme A thioesterase PaaI-like protein